jgi:hypothetical protein
LTVTQEEVRSLALGLPEAQEAPHFDRASFRVRGKIFATLPPAGDSVVLMLPPEIQSSVIQAHPSNIRPLPAAWQRRGATELVLEGISSDELGGLLASAWRRVAPKSLLNSSGMSA